MIRSVARLALILALVGAVAAVCLGITYAVTRNKIAEQAKQKEAEACVESLSSLGSTEKPKEMVDLERRARKKFPEVKKILTCGGVGASMVVKSMGFGGPITIAVGIDREGKVVGISVISHEETPGLGGDMVKESFLGQFKGKTADDSLEIGEDIQAITGATITSKAATAEIKTALEAFKEFVQGNL